MSNVTDDRLDRMLSDYYDKAEPDRIYVFDPEKVKRKPPVPLFRYRMAAAAAAVLVCALSLTAYLLFRNEPDDSLVIAPILQSSVAPTEQGTGDGGDNISSTTEAGSTDIADVPTDSSAVLTAPTDTHHTPISSSSEHLTETQMMQEPTRSPAQIASESSAAAETQAPTVEVPDAPTQSTPTEPPDPPWELPFDPPWELPEEPTQSAGQTPTAPASTEPVELTLCRVTISRNLRVLQGTVVYCRITNSDGSVAYGDPDLYSDEHLAVESGTFKNLVTYRYRPGDHGLMLKKNALFCYYFYDASGNILASGSEYNSSFGQ
ncbi:MAG: hypothetical protein IJH07_01670 [Ruminococcus sp.]|nr:hypothetical protein [Ruminococcus sp.]